MGKKKKEARDGEKPAFRNNPFAALQELEAPPAPARPKTAPNVAKSVDPPQSEAWPDKLVLRRERKGRGGKTVTCVAGVAASRRQAVAKEMKKALGCGATLEGEEIVLLGSLVDRAADWLEAQGATRVVRGN